MAKETVFDEIRVRDFRVEEEPSGNNPYFIFGEIKISYIYPYSWFLTKTRREIIEELLEKIFNA